MSQHDRVTAWFACRACGNRQRVPVHPDDQGTTINVGCPECGDSHEHVPGGFG